MCGRAEDIILVTFNHLDTIRSLIGDSAPHIAILNSTARTITDVSTHTYTPTVHTFTTRFFLIVLQAAETSTVHPPALHIAQLVSRHPQASMSHLAAVVNISLLNGEDKICIC